jgi:hypothetical protein
MTTTELSQPMSIDLRCSIWPRNASVQFLEAPICQQFSENEDAVKGISKLNVFERVVKQMTVFWQLSLKSAPMLYKMLYPRIPVPACSPYQAHSTNSIMFTPCLTSLTEQTFHDRFPGGTGTTISLIWGQLSQAPATVSRYAIPHIYQQNAWAILLFESAKKLSYDMQYLILVPIVSCDFSCTGLSWVPVERIKADSLHSPFCTI